MELRETTFRSQHLQNERQIWLQIPAGDQPLQMLCLLLDGEYYVQRMNTPADVAELWMSATLPCFAMVYVSHLDGSTRWTESFCNEKFADFVCQELLPWALNQSSRFADTTRTILGGLSLTGLAAAHVALVHPKCFSGVLCQSASFWWSDNWLVDRFRKESKSPSTFRITCGISETDENVDHGNGLIQRTSQLASNRAMRDALCANLTNVLYEELDGGHDLASWEEDLPNSLRLLSQ